MLDLIGPAVASFFVCFLAILALRPLAIAVDLVDRPGGRKTHHGEVPIVGGIAMFLGVTLGLGLLAFPHSVGTVFLAACALLVTTGLLDDRFDLSPWARLPAQAGAALLLIVGAGATVTSLGAPLGGDEIFLSGAHSWVFTVFVTVAAINAFNMLDGMDGLAGAMAAIALSAVAWMAWNGGAHAAAGASLVMIGAVSAFLLFNLPIRINREVRCFMGDAGSTLLGLSIVWLCIGVSQGPHRAASPAATLWVVALPIYELVWTTVRRLSRGVSPFKADSEHFHHLVFKAGFGVRAAFAIFVSLAAVLAGLGVLIASLGVPDWVSLSMFIFTGIAVVRLMYRADMFLQIIPESLRRSPPLEQSTV